MNFKFNEKTKLSMLMLLLMSLIMTVPVYVNAADLSLGITSWYSMWDEESKEEGGGKITTSPDNTLMAGPMVGFRFYDRWNLGLQFYVGKMTNNLTQTTIDGSDTQIKDEKSKYTRYDSDLTLGYQWLPWLSTFAGYKLSGYKEDDSFVIYKNGAFDGTKEQKDSKQLHGFGLGLSMFFPIYESLYLSVNGSWIYIKGSCPSDTYEYDTNGNLSDADNYNYDIDGWGLNGTTAISYYFSSASITLSLGFRYQYYKYDMEDDGRLELKDKFYGFTLAAIYNIPGL